MFALTHTLDSWGKNVIFSFLKIVMLHVKLNDNEAANTMQATILPSRWGQKVKTLFLKKAMLHITLKGKKCRTLYSVDLMHTPGLLGWVKGQKSKLCK